MSRWIFRAIWPIEDSGMAYSAATRAAAEDLPNVAAETGAVVIGVPTFRVVDAPDWPDVDVVVVCEVDAVPGRDRWPDAVRELAGEGWTDKRIADLLRTTTDRVRGVRRRHGIEPGTPQPGVAA